MEAAAHSLDKRKGVAPEVRSLEAASAVRAPGPPSTSLPRLPSSSRSGSCRCPRGLPATASGAGGTLRLPCLRLRSGGGQRGSGNDRGSSLQSESIIAGKVVRMKGRNMATCNVLYWWEMTLTLLA